MEHQSRADRPTRVRLATAIMADVASRYRQSIFSVPRAPDTDGDQNFWVKDHRQVYLVGNPVVWWSSTFGICLYVAIRAFYVLRAKRGFRDLHQRELPKAFR